MSERLREGFRIPIAAVVVGVVLLVMAGATVLNDWNAQQELARMPDDARRALYMRVHDALHSACPHAQGEKLREYCRDQAEFLSRFSECDDSCQRLCKQYAPQPTK